MQTLDRLGDRAGALEAYEAFAKRLAAELEADPAPETRALAGAVRERVATLSSNATELPPLETAAALPEAAGVPHLRRRWLGVAAALLGLAVVVAAVSLRSREPAPLNAKRVLVVPFANRTDDSTLDPLGNLAADWITRGLALTGKVEIADPGTMVLGGTTGSANRPREAGHEAAAVRALSPASGSGLAGGGSLYPRGGSLGVRAPDTHEGGGGNLHPPQPGVGRPRGPRPAPTIPPA